MRLMSRMKHLHCYTCCSLFSSSQQPWRATQMPIQTNLSLAGCAGHIQWSRKPGLLFAEYSMLAKAAWNQNMMPHHSSPCTRQRFCPQNLRHAGDNQVFRYLYNIVPKCTKRLIRRAQIKSFQNLSAFHVCHAVQE